MKTILIACAYPERANIINQCLDQAGFAVQVVSSGATLLDALERSTPDLVIIFGELTDVSRITITRMLRADPALAKTYIMLLGDAHDERERLLGFEAGADLCLSGIIQPNVLVARVRAMLRRIPQAADV